MPLPARLNLSAAQYTEAFMASAEYQARFGGQDDLAFLHTLYQNALGRAPDDSGLAFWSDYLAAGNSRAELVGFWINAPEVRNALYGTDGLWLG